MSMIPAMISMTDISYTQITQCSPSISSISTKCDTNLTAMEPATKFNSYKAQVLIQVLQPDTIEDFENAPAVMRITDMDMDKLQR